MCSKKRKKKETLGQGEVSFNQNGHCPAKQTQETKADRVAMASSLTQKSQFYTSLVHPGKSTLNHGVK